MQGENFNSVGRTQLQEGRRGEVCNLTSPSEIELRRMMRLKESTEMYYISRHTLHVTGFDLYTPVL
jgi:hypothetical protein